MTRDQQRLADYLAHITEAIERIDRHAKHSKRLGQVRNQPLQRNAGRCVVLSTYLPGRVVHRRSFDWAPSFQR